MEQEICKEKKESCRGCGLKYKCEHWRKIERANDASNWYSNKVMNDFYTRRQ